MKETIPLKERLMRYFLKRHGEWVSSGELQRLVSAYTTQTPRTCVRRLQELHEAGDLERKLIKGHSWYRAKPKINYHTHAKDMIRMFDSYPLQTNHPKE